MSKPVARLGDMHTCPMVTGPTPHVGGPIAGPGAPTVLAEGAPVAVVGDSATCTGPADLVVSGAPTVLAEDRPLAAMTSPTAHGGVVVAGAPTVLVGGVAAPPQAGVLQTDRPFCEECEEAVSDSTSHEPEGGGRGRDGAAGRGLSDGRAA